MNLQKSTKTYLKLYNVLSPHCRFNVSPAGTRSLEKRLWNQSEYDFMIEDASWCAYTLTCHRRKQSFSVVTEDMSVLVTYTDWVVLGNL